VKDVSNPPGKSVFPQCENAHSVVLVVRKALTVTNQLKEVHSIGVKVDCDVVESQGLHLEKVSGCSVFAINCEVIDFRKSVGNNS